MHSTRKIYPLAVELILLVPCPPLCISAGAESLLRKYETGTVQQASTYEPMEGVSFHARTYVPASAYLAYHMKENFSLRARRDYIGWRLALHLRRQLVKHLIPV